MPDVIESVIESPHTPGQSHGRLRSRGARLVPVLLATTVLVGGVSLSADAAPEKPVLAGKTTRSAKTTTIKTTGDGPALRLKSRTGRPPLAVNSGALVAQLNADQVDGVDAADLQTRTLAYRLPAGGTPARSTDHTFPGLPEGTYVMSYTAVLVGTREMVTGRCYVSQPGAGTYTALSYNATRGTSHGTVSAGASLDTALGDPVLECNSTVPFVIEQGEVLFTPTLLKGRTASIVRASRGTRAPDVSRSADGS